MSASFAHTSSACGAVPGSMGASALQLERQRTVIPVKKMIINESSMRFFRIVNRIFLSLIVVF
jgi:N-methylhydantoinase B/oxoprolinase/acetone carboxylase alpha subunit